MSLHGSCTALAGDGVLLLGPPGSGKSDLLLRLMGRGWSLVADDQVELTPEGEALLASPPAALRGMLEVRGLGLLRDLPVEAPVRLRLAVLLQAGPPPRLPAPGRWDAEGRHLPLVTLRGLEPSSPDKVALALAAACGRQAMAAGAFAA